MKKTKKTRIIILFTAIVVIAILLNVLVFKKLVKVVVMEIGTEMPSVSEFIKNKNTQGKFITDISKVNTWKPGTYEIEIQIDNKIYSSKLEIVDTIAPAADVVNQEVWVQEEIQAKEFVENIVDETEVAVYYKDQPDFSKIGTQKVLVILEDTSENITEIKGVLKVKKDTEPPKIDGEDQQSVFIGDKVSYRKNITVADNKDENVELVVDSSKVNLKSAGSYDVTYTATDSSGNKSTKIITYNVKVKPEGYIDPADLDLLADEVLATIITEDMSQEEKAKAIYKWTKYQIRYVYYANNTDWVKAAYQGITKRSGDCYVYYATAQELLTRAGIENQGIVKDGGGHYWNLVNLGNGWYHYDATPRVRSGDFYMLTDAELEKYSKRNKNSHIFDKGKYPATPLE